MALCSPNVLCVDDCAATLLLAKAMLEGIGFRVFTASDSRAALNCMRQHPIDAAIIDNEMPGMTGIELAGEIKRKDRNVPVLMFSGSLPLPQQPETRAIDAFVNKGDGPQSLLKAVRALIKGKFFGSNLNRRLPKLPKF